jgi:hypothetical protein
MKDNIQTDFKETEYNVLTGFKCLGTGSLARCCEKSNKHKEFHKIQGISWPAESMAENWPENKNRYEQT